MSQTFATYAKTSAHVSACNGQAIILQMLIIVVAVFTPHPKPYKQKKETAYAISSALPLGLEPRTP